MSTLFQRINHRTRRVRQADLVADWPFEVGVNLYQPVTAAPQLVYSNIDKMIRGFGTFADPGRNGTTFAALNAIDRYPTEDFGFFTGVIPFSASAQTLHCKLLGTATITTTVPGWSITNVSVVGDDTLFDVSIAAGATQAAGIFKFANTKRLTTDVGTTGCRGITMRSPGIALDDPALMMPYMADALAPFSYIRYIYPQQILDNCYTVTPGDRCKPGVKQHQPGWITTQTVSVEDCVGISNELGKSAWIHIPIAADDDLVREIATVVRDNLDPDLWCLFEYGNENWNPSFSQFYWVMSKAMDEVNGFVWSYPCAHTIAFTTRTANVVTAEFDLPHDLAVGDLCYAKFAGPSGQSVTGLKTIASVDSPTVVTWAETGANYARAKETDALFSSGSFLATATRAGKLMTLAFGRDHNMTAGVTQVRTNGITGLSTALTTISTTPTPRSITMPCAMGVDGPITLTGASSLVADFTGPLNRYDNAQDQHILTRRWYAKRTKEISAIVQSVFGADFGTRAKIGLFNQPGNNQYDQVTFLNTVYGTVSDYIHVIGQGTYAQLNATSGGGPNLRDVDTYLGNTPPSKQDYADCWEMTSQIINSNGANGGTHDGTAMTARLYGLEMCTYEFGPDATHSGSQSDAGLTATKLQKIDTLHDPVYGTDYYLALLDTLETSGFTKITAFNSAAVPVGTASNNQSWGIFRDYTDPTASPRFNAIVDRLGATRLGPTRNLLSRSAPVNIDGRMILGEYDASGAFPPAVATSTSPMQNWIVTAPEDGDWVFTPTFASSSGTRNIKVEVNGVALPNYSIPVGAHVMSPVTVSLTRGHNVIRTVPGTANPGATVTVINFLFEPL